MTETELNALLAGITPANEAARAAAHAHWASLAKPLGGLGRLETMLEDAAALLEDKDAMAGRLDDVGLEADKLTFSEKDWNALEEVVDPLVPEAKGEY